MYTLYRIITTLASPIVPVFLNRRLARGKEDAARLNERFGVASQKRGEGKLVWIHAASVGEANAVLPLIDALLASSPVVNVLLTTVTVTSARLMAKRLPARAVHQYAPVDTPCAVNAFLSHWQPDIALWVDSEFWPNLILKTHQRGVVTGVVNARMSQRSARTWQYALPLIKRICASFTFCFAQSAQDKTRLAALGMRVIPKTGNIKYDAPPLPYDEAEANRLQAMIGNRRVWLAASTHPGEDMAIARVHTALKASFPDLLTIIIPRHTVRADTIISEVAPLAVAQRSRNQPITVATDVYLADTMGELGLFYRLAPIAFIGGSLVAHGGQNPLEAAQLGAAIVFGPHTENFTEICAGLEQAVGALRITYEEQLFLAVKGLFGEPARAETLAGNARAHVTAGSGETLRIMKELQPYLASVKA